MRHHGEALRKLTKNDDRVASISEDPDRAGLDDRRRTFVDFALLLTRTPARLREDDLEALRLTGLTDAGIHDLVMVTAYFNFVNRTALGLGVELEPEFQHDPGA